MRADVTICVVGNFFATPSPPACSGQASPDLAAGWSTLLQRRHEIAVDLHQVRMAYSTSPALAAVCRRSRGSVRFHWVLQAAIRKRAQANKKSCYTRKSALGPAPGGLRQPQAGGHLRWATAASYKPEVQSGRGLCQPQARSGSHCQPGLPPQPSGSRSAGPAATAFWFRVSRACRHRLSDPVGYASRKPGVISGGPCQPATSLRFSQGGGYASHKPGFDQAGYASHKPGVRSGRA